MADNLNLPLDNIEVMDNEMLFVLGGAADSTTGTGSGCGCGCDNEKKGGAGCGCGCKSDNGCGSKVSGNGCGCGCDRESKPVTFPKVL